jgi:hypothetical protein
MFLRFFKVPLKAPFRFKLLRSAIPNARPTLEHPNRLVSCLTFADRLGFGGLFYFFRVSLYIPQHILDAALRVTIRFAPALTSFKIFRG